MPIYLCTCCGCSRNSAFSQDIYPNSGVVLADFLHIPRTCTTFACVADIFHFGDLAANVVVHMTWMFQEFHIFPEHLSGHQGCFLMFFTHTWDMYCIFTCGWPILFHIFSHQIICVHPANAPEILHFPGTFAWTWGLFFSGFLDTTSCRCSSFS